MRRLRYSNGFTLVEVMIASAISLMAISMIFGIFASGKDVFEVKRAQADLQARGRQAMDMMTRELRSATRTSNQTPSPNLDVPSTPNNKQVDFYLPLDKDSNGYITSNATGLIEWDTNSKVQYQYIPGQEWLRRLVNGDQTTIAWNVTDIRFIDADIDNSLYNNELKIILTLKQATAKGRTLNMTFTSMVKLRN
jgi:prepilin-type N-terminal cleavage/methylation domain-containing protein